MFELEKISEIGSHIWESGVGHFVPTPDSLPPKIHRLPTPDSRLPTPTLKPCFEGLESRFKEDLLDRRRTVSSFKSVRNRVQDSSVISRWVTLFNYCKPGFFRELVNFAICSFKYFATGNFRALRISKFREFNNLLS